MTLLAGEGFHRLVTVVTGLGWPEAPARTPALRSPSRGPRPDAGGRPAQVADALERGAVDRRQLLPGLDAGLGCRQMGRNAVHEESCPRELDGQAERSLGHGLGDLLRVGHHLHVLVLALL